PGGELRGRWRSRRDSEQSPGELARGMNSSWSVTGPGRQDHGGDTSHTSEDDTFRRLAEVKPAGFAQDSIPSSSSQQETSVLPTNKVGTFDMVFTVQFGDTVAFRTVFETSWLSARMTNPPSSSRI